jgi:hypothetical protein
MKQAGLHPCRKSISNRADMQDSLKEDLMMKITVSTTMILLAITMITLSALAGSPANRHRGKQTSSEFAEKESYTYINFACNAVFQSKSAPASLNAPTVWCFHGFVTNTTGKGIPKGARINYYFSSSKPGYFQTAGGGLSTLQGTLYLKEPLAANASLFIGSVTFVTTRNPPQINGTAQYWKRQY